MQVSSQSSGAHPRRPPAHKSVSLLHSPRPHRVRQSPSALAPRSTSNSNESSSRPTTSPSSLKPLIGKGSSGDGSNAESWFEKTNNHTSGDKSSFVDNDPPFFLQKSSSEEETQAEQFQRLMHNRNLMPGNAIPLRAGLLRHNDAASSSDDFRSVIDDLTIENKKLKRKLKNYESLQDSHLRDQKLFEVRVHGLPTAKKRELEDMLRKFAMGLNNDPTGNDSTTSLYERLVPGLSMQKSAASTNPGLSKSFVDSAYASASASGQGSSAQSSSDSKKKHFTQTAKSRQQGIQAYLHDIPRSQIQISQEPVAMTEKAKKKLIVRRLEQIFAGKGAAMSGHQHPIQQQQVSQIAAQDDRSAAEADGHQHRREGGREAQMMLDETEDPIADSTQRLNPSIMVQEHDFAEKSPSDKSATEQRPTRPLDLDPQRAQVPADNIQYIRHLGFSPPGADTMESPTDDHGWIYLNVLTNMAQLHTINVTTDFIKKAITDMSKKFEVSGDGRKVRWKGGRSVTRTSSEGEATPSMSTSVSGDKSDSPRKRMKMDHEGDESESNQSTAKKSLLLDNRITYTPLFHHRNCTEDSDSESSSEDEDVTDSANAPLNGDSSAMTSSGIRTTSSKRAKKTNVGPIIFYNNARFCTDLSGDAKTEETMLYNPILYHNATSQPVGAPHEASSSPKTTSETRGPLNQMKDLPEAMDLDDNPIPHELELQFPIQSPLESQQGQSARIYNFEVSGLGGVCPADNFAINVESRHARLDDDQAPSGARRFVHKAYPNGIAKILNDSAPGRTSRSALHKEILSTRHEELPPSELPPATCFMPCDDSDADESDDIMDDDMSMYPDMDTSSVPAAAPQRIEIDYVSTDGSDNGQSDGDEEDDESDDGSLDFLATAREVDPETIRAREREYDANMAERLAEEIPAGSSAATAGGGSGFASPMSGVDMEEYERAKKAHHEARAEMKAAKLAAAVSDASSRAGLKRPRTDDSMIVHG